MSKEIEGGLDYARLRRHYDNDDFVSLAFGAVETFYVVGVMAYLNDPNVVGLGWTMVPQPSPVAPAWWPPAIAWPALLPSFEAKDLLFFADHDCWIRFAGPLRVQHFIPANTYMRFYRRCFVFYVVRDTADGTLRCWLFG